MKQRPIISVLLTGEKDSIQRMQLETRLSHIDFSTLATIQFEKCALSISAEEELERLNSYDYLFFTSARAVQFFADSLWDRAIVWKKEEMPPAMVVGPMTAQACEKAGFIVVSMPSEFTTEHMVQEFPNLSGSKVLYPRSTIAPRDTLTALGNSGADVTELQIYKTVYRTEGLFQEEEESLRHAEGIVFLSPSSIESFMTLTKADEYHDVLETSMILCIGPRTARTANRYHFKNVVVAARHTTQGIVDVLRTLEK